MAQIPVETLKQWLLWLNEWADETDYEPNASGTLEALATAIATVIEEEEVKMS